MRRRLFCNHLHLRSLDRIEQVRVLLVVVWARKVLCSCLHCELWPCGLSCCFLMIQALADVFLQNEGCLCLLNKGFQVPGFLRIFFLQDKKIHARCILLVREEIPAKSVCRICIFFLFRLLLFCFLIFGCLNRLFTVVFSFFFHFLPPFILFSYTYDIILRYQS